MACSFQVLLKELDQCNNLSLKDWLAWSLDVTLKCWSNLLDRTAPSNLSILLNILHVDYTLCYWWTDIVNDSWVHKVVAPFIQTPDPNTFGRGEEMLYVDIAWQVQRWWHPNVTLTSLTTMFKFLAKAVMHNIHCKSLTLAAVTNSFPHLCQTWQVRWLVLLGFVFSIIIKCLRACLKSPILPPNKSTALLLCLPYFMYSICW